MAAKKTTKSDKSELIEALDIIEKEKQISKEVILEAIENSLLAACKNQFGKSENIKVNVNRETGEVKVFAIKEVVDDDDLEDEATQMGITEAILVHDKTEIGDTVEVEVTPKNFGRIAAQKAKQVVVQKIREEERKFAMQVQMQLQLHSLAHMHSFCPHHIQDTPNVSMPLKHHPLMQ